MQYGWIDNGTIGYGSDNTKKIRWRINGNLVEWISAARPSPTDINAFNAALGDNFTHKWNKETL